MIEQWAMLINPGRMRIVKKRANILREGKGQGRKARAGEKEGMARYPGGNQQRGHWPEKGRNKGNTCTVNIFEDFMKESLNLFYITSIYITQKVRQNPVGKGVVGGTF